MISSQELEERRKAYVAPDADFVHKIGICGTRISKRKVKTFYKSKANCDFDKADWFEDRETKEQEIRDNQFLENGEHNGNIYGT